MKGLKTIVLASLVGAALGAQKPAPVEWPAYGGDAQGRRYSPLTQINTQNVAALKLAWQYGVVPPASGESAPRVAASSQAVPIVVNGLLFTPTAQRTIVA